MGPRDRGPDIVIAGAARSGTSYLASLLGDHPCIDSGAIKEPNYFSREFGRGPEWYESLFGPRQPGIMRLDASVSYTFQHFPSALAELARSAPNALVVYAVREPISRAHSHYLLHRDYFANESSPDFGTALRHNPVYTGASDYSHWLTELRRWFAAEQILVVPFTAITRDGIGVTNCIYRLSGLPEADADVAQAEAHRNDVVEFKYGAIRTARRWAKRHGAYPWLRRTLGAERMRKLRAKVTREVSKESLPVALASCDPGQLGDLMRLYASAVAAVAEALGSQDERLALNWGAEWRRSAPSEGLRALVTPEVDGA